MIEQNTISLLLMISNSTLYRMLSYDIMAGGKYDISEKQENI